MQYISLDVIGEIEVMPKPAGALLLAIQAMCIVRPESLNKSKQWLYHVHTVTVESRDERRFLTKSLALSENECVLV